MKRHEIIQVRTANRRAGLLSRTSERWALHYNFLVKYFEGKFLLADVRRNAMPCSSQVPHKNYSTIYRFFAGYRLGYDWCDRPKSLFNPCPWHKTPAFAARSWARNRAVPDASLKTLHVTVIQYKATHVRLPPDSVPKVFSFAPGNTKQRYKFRCPDNAVPGMQVGDQLHLSRHLQSTVMPATFLVLTSTHVPDWWWWWWVVVAGSPAVHWVDFSRGLWILHDDAG